MKFSINIQQFSKIFTLFFVANLFFSQAALAGWDEGVAAFKAKNFKLAVQEFKTHIKANPEEWRGHYMLGLSYYLGQAYSSNKQYAERSLRKAYDLNPNDLSLKAAMKRYLNTSGQKQEAAAQYMYGTTALKLGMKDGRAAKLKAVKLDGGFGLYKE